MADDNGTGTLDPVALERLLVRASELVGDHAKELEDVLAATDWEQMPADRAERFYTRVIVAIREYEAGPMSEQAQAALAADVRREVADLVTSNGERPQEVVDFIEAYGFTPRPVRPTPVFNGLPVEMTEGFVDLETLRLWADNARSELHTIEFEEVNGRPPDISELTKLVTGEIVLPGTDSKDPFIIRPLAQSIARKGIERPLIVKADGTVLDGNRRWAASHLVLADDEFGLDEKQRARSVRIWRLAPDATDDQIDAVVVALNFEPDLKEPWPEYVKARRVTALYDELREAKGQKLSDGAVREVKRKVAKRFSIKTQEVTRYVNMVRWAEDFQDYNAEEAGHDIGAVRHRTNRIFQWFYEIDAGRGQQKLRTYIEADDELKSVVYDLMYQVLDSGAQVRALHKVVADADAASKLLEAHKLLDGDGDGDVDDRDDRRAEALGIVKDAIDDANARRKQVTRAKAGFDEFLGTVVERFGKAAPDDWSKVDPELLREVLRVSRAATGSIEGVLGITEDEVAS